MCIFKDFIKLAIESSANKTPNDDAESIDFPTPFEHGHGTDDVYVGRIRKGLDKNNTLNLWVVADNVRKGAALNSIQIAEYLTRS